MSICWKIESVRKIFEMHSYGSEEKMLKDLKESLELYKTFKNDNPETLNRIEILKELIIETEKAI